ncbi:5-hydroxytryptamine receptor 3A-like isoform X2 [Bombina bombina]|uniref:5-hydroxytryptamine receptor 3A-like isoform X2 n=1 Tax=Bombina bombina TaxID=8345 RepID=UPI00235AC618|nr:5-hydroxytryptamine receptor 3A-like isoform X2 [Bombina bombina]
MYLWTVSVLLAASLLGVCNCQNNTACSYHDLLQNLSLSDISSRPVKDWTKPSTVFINMLLYTIINLDSSEQILTAFIWFNMFWEDEFLSWNPDDFCGITKMSIHSKNFWKPDLYIDEMIEDNSKSPAIPYYVVHHTGKIINSMPIRIISSCSLDIFKFPFDIQTCYLSFGSYVYTVNDLIMTPIFNSSHVTDISKAIFVSKGDWILHNITVMNQTYEFEGDWYNKVIYMIAIKRAPVVYLLNIIIPACFMVMLDIFSMFIQMETGERLGFKITVVLGFSVLLIILNNLLPNSDSPPVLGIFCCVCLAVMIFSTIGCIVISYMLTQSATEPNVPAWIRIWVLRHMARVLCFKKNVMKEYMITVMVEEGSKVLENDSKTEMVIDIQEKKSSRKQIKGSLEAKMLKKLLSEVQTIHQNLTSIKNESEAKSEWYLAALVVDRLVLIVYLFTVVIIFSIVIIVWAS